MSFGNDSKAAGHIWNIMLMSRNLFALLNISFCWNVALRMVALPTTRHTIFGRVPYGVVNSVDAIIVTRRRGTATIPAFFARQLVEERFRQFEHQRFLGSPVFVI